MPVGRHHFKSVAVVARNKCSKRECPYTNHRLRDFVSLTSESIYAYIVVIFSRRRRPVSALHFISIAAKEEKLAFAGGKIPKIVKSKH